MTNPLPAGVQVVQIGASYNTYYVLGSDGRVYVTGLNASGSAGQNGTGAVVSWTTMRNTSGAVGTSLENVQFFSAQSSAENNNGSDAIQLILDDGRVLAVGGGGTNNKLGTTTTGNITIPTLVAGTLAGKEVYTVEVGGNFSAAMMYGTADKVSYSGLPAGAVGSTTTSVSTFSETSIAGIADAPIASMTLSNPSASDLRDDTGITVNNIVVNEAASSFAKPASTALAPLLLVC
jgi:alpha-tubulin suppressor-like RCC1 family protein